MVVPQWFTQEAQLPSRLRPYKVVLQLMQILLGILRWLCWGHHLGGIISKTLVGDNPVAFTPMVP
jgi:hypothetical protein